MGLLESAGAVGEYGAKFIGNVTIPIFLFGVVACIVALVWAARSGKIDIPRITEYPIRAIVKRRRMGSVVWDTTESLRKFQTNIGLYAYKFKNSGEIIPRSRVDSILPSIGDPIIFLDEVAAGEYYPLKDTIEFTEKLDKDGKQVLDENGKVAMVEVTGLAPRILPEVSTWIAYLLRYFNEHHKVESLLEKFWPLITVTTVALLIVIMNYANAQSTKPMSDALLANARAIAEFTNVTRELIASGAGRVVTGGLAP
jgi:hypothetical protein